MKPELGLLLVLAVVAAAELCAEYLMVVPAASPQLRTALSVGLLIIGGWLAGRSVERVKLPAITGYLLLGILVGPSLLGLVPESQVRGTEDGGPPLQFASDLAVSLIALLAGGEIQVSWLRSRGVMLIALLGAYALLVLLATVGLFALAQSWIPFLADEPWLVLMVAATLAAVVTISASPAVAVVMVSEYRAHGPLSQATLALTVLIDLLLIVLFATVMTLSQGLLNPDQDISGAFLVAVAIQLFGSIGLGAAIGLAMAWYVERIRAHLAVFVVGCCLLIALIGEQHFTVLGEDLHLEVLLMALSAGLLMRNAWPRRSGPLFHTMERMSLPVFCLFFALAGAQVELSTFASLWPLSLALVAVRALTAWAGLWLGAAAARIQGDWSRHLWLGMIPQAGVSLVLVTIIADTFGDDWQWATPLKNVLLGAIIINQLIGPIGFRFALFRSGEIGRAEKRQPAQAPA